MKGSIIVSTVLCAALASACATGSNVAPDTSSTDTTPADTAGEDLTDLALEPDIAGDPTTDVPDASDGDDAGDVLDASGDPGEDDPGEEDPVVDDPGEDDPAEEDPVEDDPAVDDVGVDDPDDDDVTVDTTPDPGSPTYVMSAAGDDCDTRCGALGKTCGGYGTVGLDCGMHVTGTFCMTPGYWIYRTVDGLCYSSWGTCDVCTYNYNVYNEFCCMCL